MSNGVKRSKEVLVDFEEKMSLEKAATHLETIAKKLREEGTFSLTHGGETIEVTPAQTVELEIKVEKKNDKYEFEVELEWIEGQEDTPLQIS